MDSNKKQQVSIGDYLQIGASIPIGIVICFFIGSFIDKKLDTSPTFLIIFIFLGVVSGYRSVFKLIKEERKDNDGTTR